MNVTYPVIIVGGGMAGLTAAAYVARAGLRPLILEQKEKFGGLVQTFWHQGFAFDAGIRAFENSGILYPMLRQLDIQLEVKKNPVTIGIGKEWVKLSSREDLTRYLAMLEHHFPEQGDALQLIQGEIEKVSEAMDVLYGIDNPLFLDSYRDLNYVIKTLLPWLLKYHWKIKTTSRLSLPIYEHLLKMTDHRPLADMIAQHFFAKTPTFFALSYFNLYLDYSYPKGGTGALVQAMVEWLTARGADMRLNTKVVAVNPQERLIRLENGETLAYDQLIWAGNQKSLYAGIEGATNPLIEAQRTKVAKARGGNSVLSFFLGTSLPPETLEATFGDHAFYTPSTLGLSSLPHWKDGITEEKKELYQWVRRYLERTTYEVSCPVLRDATLAPKGKTGIIISTVWDYDLTKHFQNLGEYEQFKQFCTEQVLRVFRQSALPNLEQHLDFSLCATPLTMEKETGNADGAITGWAFTNETLPAETHFPKITKAMTTPMEHLYQAGQWSFSPSGLPVSILTGKLAADAALHALKKK